jgi:type IV pilus assembly protein PilE
MRIEKQLRKNVDGFTLIELMIAVAVIAVISAIAFPYYTDYIETSRQGVLLSNIRTIEVFQEDFRLRTGSFYQGPGDLAAITAAIDWEPDGDEPGTTYAIAPGAGDAYEVTATSPDGTSVCLILPDGGLC